MNTEKLKANKPGENEVWIQGPSPKYWIRFRDPRRILTAFHLDEVLPVLRRVEAAVNGEGLTAAGFVSYEAAPAFDGSCAAKTPDGDFPLAWFGLYSQADSFRLPAPETPYPEGDWVPSISKNAYDKAIRRIKEYIAAGETYQVNFSFRLRKDTCTPPWDRFLHMISPWSRGYGAYIETENWAVCSASPELFFRLQGNRLVSRPMKGTMPRGRWSQEDQKLLKALHHSPKDRAENLMIVDMVRNDLGRIADTGSVKAERLFEIEKYPTLFQMTGSVECLTDASLEDIFKALFPAASITGAPKIRTTQIITELEDSPRRIYTGTIGYLAPGRKAQFNVAIRTALVNKSSGRAEYGIGGGVVWDSTEEVELAECYAKAAVLTRRFPNFDLLESLLWDPESGFPLLEKHLSRLADSAAYFDRTMDRNAVRIEVDRSVRTLPAKAHKIRLLLDSGGKVRLESEPLRDSPNPYRVCTARNPVDSSDIFLFHKTTCRQTYDRARQDHPKYDDVLLWNEKGELTESTIANIAVELDGKVVTPPVECGLLPGIYRDRLLAENTISTRIIRRQDLSRCTRIYLMNAVRGMWEVQLEG